MTVKARSRRPPHGRNYLVNEGVARAIAAAATPTGTERVLEIGAGPGALTRCLLPRAQRVVAVELDAQVAQRLRDELGEGPRLSVIAGDALTLPFADLIDDTLGGTTGVARVAGNLPYDVGTSIVLRYLEHSARDPRVGGAVFMLQREVAERLAAGPGSKAHGSLGVLAQCTHRVSTLMDVAPGSFRPVPRVDSRVIVLERLATPAFPLSDWSRQAAFVRRAFSRRRKQLAGVLAEAGDATRAQWQASLQALGCAATSRAEDLTPAQLVALARCAP